MPLPAQINDAAFLIHFPWHLNYNAVFGLEAHKSLRLSVDRFLSVLHSDSIQDKIWSSPTATWWFMCCWYYCKWQCAGDRINNLSFLPWTAVSTIEEIPKIIHLVVWLKKDLAFQSCWLIWIEIFYLQSLPHSLII